MSDWRLSLKVSPVADARVARAVAWRERWDVAHVPLQVARGAWAVVWIFATTLSILAFVRLASEGAFEELFAQSPLSLNPAIRVDLVDVLGFAPVVITTGQVLIHVGGYALYLGVSLIIIGRRFDDQMRLLSSAMLATLGAALFSPLVLLDGSTVGRAAAEFVGVLRPDTPEFWMSVGGVLLVAFGFTFPNGRFAPVWTMPFFALYLVLIVGWAMAPGSPFDPARWPGAAAALLAVALPTSVAVAQVVRYLGRSADEQRRTRLVVVALVGALVVYLALWTLQPEIGVSGDLVLATPRMHAINDVNLLVLLTITVFLFPVSILVSVLRHRLWDVDLVINQALVYATLTFVVAATALAVAASVGLILDQTTSGSLSALSRGAGVVTAVVLVAAFQPLRNVVQRGIDRRFYREKYDGEQAVEAFAVRARDSVDIDLLTADLARVVESTIRSTRIVVWTASGGSDAMDPGHSLRSVLTATDDPVDLDRLSGITAADERRLSGFSLAVPLHARGELVGALLLGDRLSQSPYTTIDRRTLTRLAAIGGPAIRTAELVRRQEEQAAERERVAQELALARRIQLDLLPKSIPRYDGWLIDVFYEAAREVGGDFYDFIELGDGRIGIITGDVSGKGVPAAMVMATCRTALRGAANDAAATPGEVLARTNEILVPDLPPVMFVTCLFMALDRATGDIVVANAGHNLPYLRGRGGVREVRATGLPLGLMPDMEYEEITATIAPGESVLLLSDGVTEAHGEDGEMFGFERVVDLVEASAGETAVNAVKEALISFTPDGAEQEDDVTILGISRDAH